MSLQQQFQEYWKQKGFGKNGKHVLLAASGGIDSMAMATLCLQSNVPFGVAHCNFQLRGEEADKDEQLVANWCKEHGITFHNVRFDTQAKVDEWKKGIQETARILRYDWLERIRAEHGYSYIATAHHANDNAETLLMNLFKGTGITGLHGIQAINGYIIRPLLFAAKKDVIAYVQEQHISYRDDASNATDKYLRNDVRLNLLPVIEKSFPQVIDNLNNSIQRFADAEVLYKRAIEQERKKLIEKRGNDLYIPIRKLQHRTPLNTICYELFTPYGFTAAQVPHIVALLSSESGHYISSSTHRVIRNRDFLIVTTVATTDTDFIAIDTIPAVVQAGNQQYKFAYQDNNTVTADNNIAYINAAKLEQPLILRRWKQGDYFYPLGMGMKKKKLSRYMMDKKIPLHEKEQVWVLESNKRIVWVAGHRLDERFKITPNTDKVLVVKTT